MMELKAVPKNDRLGRWCVLDMSTSGNGKPVIADNIRTEKMAVLLASSIQLQLALTEAAEWIRTRDDFKVSASEALKPIEALLKGLV